MSAGADSQGVAVAAGVPRVVLLRTSRATDEQQDPYVTALKAAGFRARCVPVLRFEEVGDDALGERIARPEDYAGLILTSRRAIRRLAERDLMGWKRRPAFVVGPATAAAATELGLLPEGAGAGSADALAARILARSFQHPLLFLCGDRRRDVLPERLRAAGVAFEELVVYRTVGDAEALSTAVLDDTDWVVFFSPSGVEAADDDAGSLADPSWNRVRKAAIGPTTADALRAAGTEPDAVAAAPTPAALSAALRTAARPHA